MPPASQELLLEAMLAQEFTLVGEGVSICAAASGPCSRDAVPADPRRRNCSSTWNRGKTRCCWSSAVLKHDLANRL